MIPKINQKYEICYPGQFGYDRYIGPGIYTGRHIDDGGMELYEFDIEIDKYDEPNHAYFAEQEVISKITNKRKKKKQ